MALRRAWGWIGLVLGVLLIAVGGLTVRGLRHQPPTVTVAPAAITLSNGGAIVDTLSAAVQIRTVSGPAGGPDSATEFDQWLTFLQQRFPEVYSQLKFELVGERSLLFTWNGTDVRLPPVLFTAHYDVVPADGEGWTHPPFSGAIDNGFVYGRGALDDKLAVIGLLSAASELLKQGFAPARTLVFAFGHDEEIGGANGAAQLTTTLQERGIKPLFILDEGMPITHGVLKGVSRPAALIGVAEKGFVNVELSAESPGGHSSAPPNNTAVGIVSRAIARLEAKPMPARLDGAVGAMFDRLAPEMPIVQRVVLGNRDILAPLLTWQLSHATTTNAMIRTTTAATMFKGSEQANVLPTHATATINFRLLPGDSVDHVLAHIRDVVNDDRVTAKVIGDTTPASDVSDVNGPGFHIIETSIRETFPGVTVAPALLIATTDTKYYAQLSDDVYRFRPVHIAPEDVARFHGKDERVSIENAREAVQFFMQLLRNSAKS